MKISILLIFVLFSIGLQKDKYAWLTHYDSNNTIEKRVLVPAGYKRVLFESGSFGEWLRNLPLKPANTPVKIWNGQLKRNQSAHFAVVDLDFVGEDLQQCVDAIIRLRAEYLFDSQKADEVKFSYTCCAEKVSWEKWKNGWRTKIIKKNGRDAFEWVHSAKFDDSRENFRNYLYSIMMYAGTWSLSNDMKKISASEVAAGDAYVQGGAPGYGHGVLILDMAVSAAGKKIVLLGQSYMPAQNFHILRNLNSPISPWFEVEFGDKLQTPEWTFTKEHVRRF